MEAFFLEIGLFSLKFFVVIGVLILFILLTLSLLASRRNLSKESLEIEKINDRLDEFKKALENETLSKEALKVKRKLDKKEEKIKEKAEKKRLKAFIRNNHKP